MQQLSTMRERRLFAAIIAAFALFLGQLGPFVHALSAQHAVCAEHGELIEASAPAKAIAHAPEARDLWTAPPSGEPGEGHEHEHCVLAVHAETTASISAADSPFDLDLGFVLALPGDAVVRASTALFRLAPKQSPPIA